MLTWQSKWQLWRCDQLAAAMCNAWCCVTCEHSCTPISHSCTLISHSCTSVSPATVGADTMQDEVERAIATSADPLPYKAGERQGDDPGAAEGSQHKEVGSMALF